MPVRDRSGGHSTTFACERRRSLVPAAVRLLVWAAILSCAGGIACATDSTGRQAWNEPGVELYWPADSNPPRIQYLGSLRSRADLGGDEGLFTRLKSALFGVAPIGLLKPVAVAKNHSGILVVADPGLPAVHVFDLGRRKHRRLEGDAASLLRSPVGVAVDDTGHVFVTDSFRGTVLEFDSEGNPVAEFGKNLLERPTGLALDSAQEHLYVVDTVACRVVVFDRTGNSVGGFGKRGVLPGEFNAPTSIAVSSDGTISVSDTLNFRVQRFLPDGTPITAFGLPGDGAGHFARPKGVAEDREGHLYVVDAAFENVQIFDPNGALLLPFGGPGSGPGEFLLPSGLFVDSTDTIWVADSFNRRIQVFRLLTTEP